MNNTVKTDAPLGPSPTGISYQEHLANVRAGEFAAKVNEGDCCYGLAKTTNAEDMPVVDMAAQLEQEPDAETKDTGGANTPDGGIPQPPPYREGSEERR